MLGSWRIWMVGSLVAVAVFCIAAGRMIFENVSAGEYVVIQSPVSGELKWATQPGPVWQGFGTVTSYTIRMKYDFTQNGIPIQFNDGGHGTIRGSIQCDLPGDKETLTAMHRKFPSQEQVENGLIQTATKGAIYLVGTLMSSRESYAEKKNDLIHYVTDIVQRGPYRTRQNRQWVKDPITNESKEVITAEIVMSKDGRPERQEASALDVFRIGCYQFTINKIDYDQTIEAQIKQQQQITMNVQTSMADKVLAEQRALTAEANGRAAATEAKWKQETIKATEVTKAEQEKQVALIAAEREKTVQVTNANRDKEVAETQASQRLAVAELDKKAAEQTKQQLTLLGEGEGARKRAVLEADGALEQKLQAWQNVNFKFADALRGANLVPSLVMGGTGSGQQATANDYLALLAAKAAKDISLDISIPTRPVAPRRAAELGQ